VTREGGDPVEAARWNPDLPDGPLPAGTVVVVPTLDGVVPPTSVLDSKSTDSTAVIDLGDIALVADAGPVVPAGLATPELQVKVSDCLISTGASGGTATTGGSCLVLPPSPMFLAHRPSRLDGRTLTSFTALAAPTTWRSRRDAARCRRRSCPWVPSSAARRGWSPD
jgi:hypothetical protein